MKGVFFEASVILKFYAQVVQMELVDTERKETRIV